MKILNWGKSGNSDTPSETSSNINKRKREKAMM
jgi:hypothetical protein